MISIHAPTRGATSDHPGNPLPSGNFNPRSHKGSDPPCFPCYTTHPYFNPRSHKGSDVYILLSLRQAIFISIHAPTRGATLGNELVKDQIRISIHAPTRGATVTFSGNVAVPTGISIHAPTRGATSREDGRTMPDYISIHAPTRGATPGT